MSDRSVPDPVSTVRRIVALLDRVGRDRDDVLRVEGEGGLSYASGLPAQDVEALMRGDRTPSGAVADEVDSEEARCRRVVERILFLRATRPRRRPDGQRRVCTLAEIAAGAGASAQCLDKMIKTGKAPNLDHADGIARFFGEQIELLVDSPAEALDRVLQHIHSDLLEQVVEEQHAEVRRSRTAGPAIDKMCEPGLVGSAARCLADVPDETAKPIVDLIESIARRARADRARETREAADATAVATGETAAD
ncbi:hypothetical protein GCM10010347_32160 [Streptomyces cirratus]|uniref:Uncharacterized protein n=1 Tax=Streptomyces cirratus TaxID=68187 RepID=A0ABQ3ET96_9ACTN|nr:hypothetical protein GCM10010347_32160 [Streptomyces cirratus]